MSGVQTIPYGSAGLCALPGLLADNSSKQLHEYKPAVQLVAQ